MRLHPVILSILIGVSGASYGAEEFVYTVQPGDHPWNIAQRYLKDASLAFRLTRLNHIANDRTVAPGTEIRIPAQWLKLHAARVRVLTTHGDVSVEVAGRPRRLAVLNEVLTAGSRLRTGAASSAMLEFEDGSRVMVRQGSEVRLVRSERRLLDEETAQARARVLDVPDGSYRLRVRAIDADGLEGLAMEQPIVVYARPQAPALISPVPDGQTTEVSPVFH